MARAAVPAETAITVAEDPAAGNVSAAVLAAMQRDLKLSAEQVRARVG